MRFRLSIIQIQMKILSISPSLAIASMSSNAVVSLLIRNLIHIRMCYNTGIVWGIYGISTDIAFASIDAKNCEN